MSTGNTVTGTTKGYSTPGPKEIAIYDAMRLGGVASGPDAEKAVSAFLDSYAVTGLLPTAKPKAVPSAKIDGELFLVFHDLTSAELVKKKLAEKEVKSEIWRNNIPDGQSWIYLDGKLYEKFVKATYPDFTKDETLFDKTYAAPLKKCMAELEAFTGGFHIEAIKGTLKRLAMMHLPLVKADIDMGPALIDQVINLWVGGRQEVSHTQKDAFLNLRTFFMDFSEKFRALRFVGTAPRQAKDSLDAVDRFGGIVSEMKMQAPGYDEKRQDRVMITLSFSEAFENYNVENMLKLQEWMRVFGPDGLTPDHVRAFKGSLRDFIRTTTQPDSPFSVALRAKSGNNPFELAEIITEVVKRVFETSVTGEQKRRIHEEWAQKNLPYLDIPAKGAVELFEWYSGMKGVISAEESGAFLDSAGLRLKS